MQREALSPSKRVAQDHSARMQAASPPVPLRSRRVRWNGHGRVGRARGHPGTSGVHGRLRRTPSEPHDATATGAMRCPESGLICALLQPMEMGEGRREVLKPTS